MRNTEEERNGKREVTTESWRYRETERERERERRKEGERGGEREM